MRKLTLGIAIVTTWALVGLDFPGTRAAQAYGGFGIYLGGPNVRVDIGRTYGYHRYHSMRGYHRGPRVPYHWHDTSSSGWHRGTHAHRRNSCRSLPSHYDWHAETHWDILRGGHRGRHH